MAFMKSPEILPYFLEVDYTLKAFVEYRYCLITFLELTY
jgi:hypothetical protein